MTRYLFLESRDPFESRDSDFVADNAVALKKRGHQVTVFLLQNGVLATRKAALDTPLNRLIEAGVNLLADDFSLLERGINDNDCLPGVRISSMDALVDLLLQDQCKAIWH